MRALPAVVLALTVVASASAHARLSPPVALANTGQLFSLTIPTEKEGAATTKVVLTVPAGFSIDSFVPAPGWKREVAQSGSGESAVIRQVTWTGGSVPTGEDALFQFLGLPGGAKTYTFTVEQAYSDGSVVDWSGPASSDAPAPTVEVRSSPGGGGTSTLTWVALVVGAVGVVAAAVALVSRSGRPLA